MENYSYNDEIIENTGFKEVPQWLNQQLFVEFLTNDFPNFQKIEQFKITPAVQTGENFMTVMLRVTIELVLKNNTKTTTSYVVKIKPMPQSLQLMIKEWKIFVKEHNTYKNYIPIFENYYQKAGYKIKFAPRLLEPTTVNITDEFLILEDLRPKGFKNYNRHLGLDLEHTKAVLEKLAQFHAASACHFLREGRYLEMYDKCLSANVELHESHRKKFDELFRENLKLYGNFQYMEDKLKIFCSNQPDPYQMESDWRTNNFNVLNHGDCWSNNIMFQYDENGQLKETMLVDFQMSRYGTPAQDLYYFLLSSTNLQIKLQFFDHFIYYYHHQLTKCLKLLQYEGRVPLLRDIHLELLKHDIWAYVAVSRLMPIILCESRDDANVDTLLNEDNDDLKRSMYTNDLYVRSMNMLLPWLDQRGAFDI